MSHDSHTQGPWSFQLASCWEGVRSLGGAFGKGYLEALGALGALEAMGAFGAFGAFGGFGSGFEGPELIVHSFIRSANSSRLGSSSLSSAISASAYCFHTFKIEAQDQCKCIFGEKSVQYPRHCKKKKNCCITQVQIDSLVTHSVRNSKLANQFCKIRKGAQNSRSQMSQRVRMYVPELWNSKSTQTPKK